MSLFQKLKRFSDKNWYAPLVGVGAAVDAFIFLIPIEALLIPSILIKPKRWWSSALWVAFGSALGAMILSYVVSIHGETYVAHLFPRLYQSPKWGQSVDLMRRHGIWALAGIAVSPIPQQPAVAFSGLVRTPLLGVLFAIFIGRAIKYLVVCGIASRAPRLFKKTE